MCGTTCARYTINYLPHTRNHTEHASGEDRRKTSANLDCFHCVRPKHGPSWYATMLVRNDTLEQPFVRTLAFICHLLGAGALLALPCSRYCSGVKKNARGPHGNPTSLTRRQKFTSTIVTPSVLSTAILLSSYYLKNGRNLQLIACCLLTLALTHRSSLVVVLTAPETEDSAVKQ